VLKTPLIIFPPWINRFYILDLNPKKSFIRWAVEQGLTVFMISWKSADESLVDIGFDDYVTAQIEIADTVRDLLASRTPTSSAIASPAPTSPPRSRSSKRAGRRTRSQAPPSSPRRSISARRATSASSWATSRWR
jgi:hypothetical protein